MKTRLISAALLLAGTASLAAWAQSPPAGAGGPGMQGPPGGMPMPNPEERFKQMDTNHDGKISLEEFQAARMMAGRRGEGRMERRGNMPPPDGNAQGQPGATPPPGGPPGAGQRMGMNRDAMFKRMDTNGDGFVSLDEYKAWWQAMAERRAQRGAQN